MLAKRKGYKGLAVKIHDRYELYGITESPERGSWRKDTLRINLLWMLEDGYFSIVELCSTWFHEFLHYFIPSLEEREAYMGEILFLISYNGKKRIKYETL